MQMCTKRSTSSVQKATIVGLTTTIVKYVLEGDDQDVIKGTGIAAVRYSDPEVGDDISVHYKKGHGGPGSEVAKIVKAT